MFLLTAALNTILGSESAYLDPGSGSILIQLLLAAILGLGVMFRSQLARIKNLFGGKDRVDDDQDDEE
ncbi:MAG: hypothetical protein HN855_06505 [Anaerolineae bacterium]|jgi:hypothetical protein|nr:hypothetical protein [Anaerolineae bacterium]MBT7071836.1 hypothetical protein [Anaerolineae bacterium]MBT7324789.1 hypothetical protein [Anaerolineae bacterium]MBT7601368.1 hypothetical protein [Anaerolineae bacterium]